MNVKREKREFYYSVCLVITRVHYVKEKAVNKRVIHRGKGVTNRKGPN